MVRSSPLLSYLDSLPLLGSLTSRCFLCFDLSGLEVLLALIEYVLWSLSLVFAAFFAEELICLSTLEDPEYVRVWCW